MQYISRYRSPLGSILLAAGTKGLTGLWFEGQKYYALSLNGNCREKELEVFKTAKEWLDIYFSGKQPDFMPPLSLTGSDFQKTVWKILLKIPYGKTVTYKEIAKEAALCRGIKSMSFQAAGGAVARNRISVIVPCHRVVGSDGSLTGYAGGIERKISLLTLEQADMSKLFVPKNI